MKKVTYLLLVLIASWATAAQAVIISFEAEDAEVYYQAGTAWQDEVDVYEDVSGGVCITGTSNMPSITLDGVRRYAFEVPAGTYEMYIRCRVDSVPDGGYNNDSVWLSDGTFEENADLSTPLKYFNGLHDDQSVDGGTLIDTFGWWSMDDVAEYEDVDYVMAANGTGYLVASPREDGFHIDAFAYVTQGQVVTSEELDDSLKEIAIRGAATDPVPESGDTEVDSLTTTEVMWTAPSDPNLVAVNGYDVYFGTIPEPNVHLNPVTAVTDPCLPVALDYETSYYWRVDSKVVWDSDEVTGSVSDTVEGYIWNLTTLGEDEPPVVTLDSDVLTSMELLPASLTGTVEDYGEEDIVEITWQVLAGGEATVTDTTNDPSSETQSATLETDSTGTYTVELTATDATEHTSSDTMLITVAANACLAAQESDAWDDFSDSDINTDCFVNLQDLAIFVSGWLEDRSLTAPE